MSINILNKMNDLINNECIFYSVSGRLTPNTMQSILANAKDGIYNKTTNTKYSDAKIDNLLVVAIELIQNVEQHRYHINNFHHDSLVISANDDIIISVRNLASKDNKDTVIKKIDFLNSLDVKELKEHSRETLMKNIDRDKNILGSGFIEIATLSQKNIEYDVCKHETYDDVFELSISIRL